MLEKIPYFCLRQSFDVCEILKDVYLANKCNVNGHAYGFVRFNNVLDVGKLFKTLNNVCFGNYWVFAKVARYDYFENSKEMETEGMLRVGRRRLERRVLREKKESGSRLLLVAVTYL